MFRDSKRNRRPVSCEQCRLRKAKCNRELPCESCVKRGERSTCKYANNAIRNSKSKNSSHSNAVDQRLQRVENLLFELIGRSTSSSSPQKIFGLSSESSEAGAGAEADSRRGVSPLETLSRDDHDNEGENGEERGHVKSGRILPTIDNKSTHWLSILDDIKEVREKLSHSQIFPEDNDMNSHEKEEVGLVLGITETPKLQEIITSLPSRPVCDKVLSQYFNSAMNLPIIHAMKFQNEYEKFWQDPAKAPVMWIGLLFSILAAAAAIRQAMEGDAGNTNTNPGLPSSKILRSRTAQCLMIGSYTNAPPYALETLILYLLGKYIGKADSSFDGWFLMGNIIRLAMRMGYHRDPKTRRDISAFEGEMRRRRWQAIIQLDILLSFQMGMPSMIPTECCNTELPRNLHDSDIYPNMESLPHSRPLSDITPVLYTIVKSGLMDVFRKIMALTQSATHLPPYSATIELDGMVREAYARIPEEFKIKSINHAFIDSSNIIISRYTLQLLYQKGLVVLHRQYLNRERLNPQYEYSRRACVDAALDILIRQTELHEATQLYGRLYEDRWMVSSLTSNDFLLASMVICLELSLVLRSTETCPLLAPPIDPSGVSIRLLDALLNSQRIWESKSTSSKEARTAALTLQLMIEKAQDNNNHHHRYHGANGSFEVTRSVNDQMHTIPSQNALHSAHVGEGGPLDAEAFGLPFGDMIDGSEILDWALLDQYLQNTDFVGPRLDSYDDNWDFLDIDES